MNDFAGPELESLWDKVTLLLLDAAAFLPETADTDWYEQVIGRNELELALDELTRLGDRHEPAVGFWTNLVGAADLMGLVEKGNDLRTRADL
ncbi:MAG: hypothetical protein LC808_27645 [Actinobacteria bacterium]|nr:hypothetical protein [Actinomycetota bacterium]